MLVDNNNSSLGNNTNIFIQRHYVRNALISYLYSTVLFVVIPPE